MGFVDLRAAAAMLADADKHQSLAILGEAPLVAETPEHLLDDDTTPIDRFFVRNNGTMPATPSNRDDWVLRVDGAVQRELELSLRDLEVLATPVRRWLVLECAGNGRAGFSPPVPGNQWANGGVGCAEWTGIPLAAVLERVGLRPEARYTAHVGADRHLDDDGPALSRGIRIEKALDPSTLLAWGMNVEPLPPIHGGPLRLVVPGWAGSASQKWLTRITILDREHDGRGMSTYRVPTGPLAPGEEADPATFRVLEALPVRSIITSPADGTRLPAGSRTLDVRGAAWAGELSVRAVDLSLDHGATWQRTTLGEQRNPYDWQRWTATVALPSDGYFEICARATDSNGTMQPYAVGSWNPGGYGGNAMHRIAVTVG